MDSAQKALDALEAAASQASARPWSNEEVPTQIGSCHMIGPFLPRGTVGSAACIYVDHRGVGCESPKAVMLRANADLIVASVNLAAPLAAVVRAVADRPWWKDYAKGLDRVECVACGAVQHKDRPREHGGAEWCPMYQADRRIDAFAVAAQEMFP